ncbi:MAG: hypothetical protein AAFW68_06585 [Pseudomonadota bacterium]
MKRMLTFLAAALTLSAGLLHAQTPAPEIHYIGFNDFIDDEAANADQVFSDYVETITPIMARYGLTLEAYRVVHANASGLAADAITFGAAPDQASFAAFFADPEFQAAFPKLVGVIEDHTVIFVDDLLPAAPDHAPAMLRLYWLQEDRAENRAKIAEAQKVLGEARASFGVEVLGVRSGLMANRGLGGEIEAVAPPDMISLTTFGDAHGYFDDPRVKSVAQEIDGLVRDDGAFWIGPWR